MQIVDVGRTIGIEQPDLGRLQEIAGQVDRENAVFLFNSPGDPTLMREGNDESADRLVAELAELARVAELTPAA